MIIPSGSDGSEDARGGAEFGFGERVVPSNTESVAVDCSGGVETKTRIKGLVDDRMGRTGYEVAKLDRVRAFEYCIRHGEQNVARRVSEESKRRGGMVSFKPIRSCVEV